MSKSSINLIVTGVFTCKNFDEIGATLECSLEIHQKLSTGDCTLSLLSFPLSKITTQEYTFQKCVTENISSIPCRQGKEYF